MRTGILDSDKKLNPIQILVIPTSILSINVLASKATYNYWLSSNNTRVLYNWHTARIITP